MKPDIPQLPQGVRAAAERSRIVPIQSIECSAKPSEARASSNGLPIRAASRYWWKARAEDEDGGRK